MSSYDKSCSSFSSTDASFYRGTRGSDNTPTSEVTHWTLTYLHAKSRIPGQRLDIQLDVLLPVITSLLKVLPGPLSIPFVDLVENRFGSKLPSGFGWRFGEFAVWRSISMVLRVAMIDLSVRFGGT